MFVGEENAGGEMFSQVPAAGRSSQGRTTLPASAPEGRPDDELFVVPYPDDELFVVPYPDDELFVVPYPPYPPSPNSVRNFGLLPHATSVDSAAVDSPAKMGLLSRDRPGVALLIERLRALRVIGLP
jgi:hypothetical protein